MSDDHEHHHHEHEAPVTPDDAGSQALAEALRSSFAIVKVVMLLMVLAFFGSGFFQVGSAGKGGHPALWPAGRRREKCPARPGPALVVSVSD